MKDEKKMRLFIIHAINFEETRIKVNKTSFIY